MKFGYLILLAGVLLSFAAAVVPHFSGAYQLMFGVLVAQLVPYMIYVPAVMRLDDLAVQVAGALLLMVHGVLVLVLRFVEGGEYDGVTIVAVPLLAALLLLPLMVRAARAPWPTDDRT